MKRTSYTEDPLGILICERLFELDKTKRWLAEQCKVTNTMIGYIVKGTRNPSTKLICGMSKALQVEYATFIKALHERTKDG